MRIIRQKIKRRKQAPNPIDKIRKQVEIFESEGIIYAHLPQQPHTWDIKQCIILDGKNSIYRGMNLFEMQKYNIELEDLDKEDLNFLIGELA